MTEHIQAILFDRNYYDVDDVYDFIKDHKQFTMKKKPRITEHEIRVRQKNPNYDKYYYKAKKVPNKHIEFIIGYPIH
jgi:hypothetical protein